MDHQIRVLHVDDDEEFAGMVAELLERREVGFRVLTAPSAEAGLEQLDGADVDCVVAGHEMPGQDGIEFLEAVRAERPDLPFILFTGKGSEEIASDAISAGVTDYLGKRSGADRYELLANRIRNAVENYRARQSVAESERRVRRIHERITDGFFAVNTDWEYTYVNERGASLVDVPAEEMLGERVWDVFPEVVGTAFEDALRTAMERQETTSLEEYYPPHETGYDVRIYPSEDGISIYFRDVSHRKEESDLAEQKAKVEALHEVAVALGSCESSDEVYEHVIGAAEEILEFDVALADAAEGDVLVPKSVAENLPEEGYYEETPIDAGDNLGARVYRTGETDMADDLRMRDVVPADARYRSALTVPIGEYGVFQAVGELPGLFDESDRELTELLIRHAEEALARIERERELERRTRELERQNERLEQFASVVSHDLRNPLNVAIGRLELVAEDCDSEHLEDVARSHERMQALIEDLLELARQGDAVTATERVALPDVVEACWGNVETATATLETVTDAVIEAHRSRLQQLVENLLRNAVEHGNGDVTITVGRLDDDAGFYLEDDGPGIPEAEREDVFEQGYSTAESGTGFGLAIVQEIAQAHDWSVAVTQGASGGARFEVTGVETVS
jgi:signal transduction histidine kinase/DNA-binding NarL/FixJ family response regulator